MVLTITASGAVSDYADTSSLRQKIATAAGVSEDAVEVIVTSAERRRRLAAGVTVETTITTDDTEAANAADSDAADGFDTDAGERVECVVEAVEVQQAVCIPSSVSSAYSIPIPHRLCPHHGKQNYHDAVPGWVEALVPRIGHLWDIDPANRYWRDERDISVAANETGTTSCPSGKISLVVETNKDSTTLFS